MERPPPAGASPDDVVRAYMGALSQARGEWMARQQEIAATALEPDLLARLAGILRQRQRTWQSEKVRGFRRAGRGRACVETTGPGGGSLEYDLAWTAEGWRLTGVWQPCPECAGEESCGECQGRGRIRWDG